MAPSCGLIGEKQVCVSETKSQTITTSQSQKEHTGDTVQIIVKKSAPMGKQPWLKKLYKIKKMLLIGKLGTFLLLE